MGAPRGAKMSTPWCHDTVARAAPHESPNELAPTTGKAYGPPESVGVPLSGGPPAHVLLPKMPATRAAGASLAGFGSATVVVVVSRRAAGAGAGVGAGPVT